MNFLNLKKYQARIHFFSDFFPFFGSAFIFFTRIFALFFPLPLLWARVHRGRKYFFLVACTNLIVVGLLSNLFGLAIYTVFGVLLSFFLIEFLYRTQSIEKAIFFTLGTMTVLSFIFIQLYSFITGVSFISELKAQLISLINQLFEMLKMVSSSYWHYSSDLERIQEEFLISLPSELFIFGVIFLGINLLLLLKLNPQDLKWCSGFFQRWKVPEVLIWPTIFSGFFLVFSQNRASLFFVIAINVFKSLMGLYAIQGFSIVSYFLDQWKVHRLFRIVTYIFSFWMMPIILSLGFFDFWLNLRMKKNESV